MHRILKPGGKLILATPSMDGLTLMEKLRGIMRQYRTFGTVKAPGTRLYTEQSLHEVISNGGFRIRESERLTDPARPGGFPGLWVMAEKI
jgi:hypothetical protein